ncbi:nuclear transport factor 2 family protein [Aquibium sp. A9E412]|uniref:nuclear transport factor 2 family protein n=1 Tax=Aquibium sp. A9E412 TaxID=2976767 RepID=UPI0025AF92F6|nr:nuclear transport factor 2 family protein [Aquibium sp. A9E412]MDN2567200.1 nuclear transport factor 2 family protein [Aquibium sp. A9E412]
MPVIRVTLIEGYEDATLQRLAARLTDAVGATIAAPLDGITVAIEEVRPAGYMRGRRPRTPGAPAAGPAETVRAFLDAVQARDLDAARAWLADGFVMTFPGGHRFTALEELVAWSRSRYRFVRKSYERIEESVGAAGPVVFCQGTLAGEWPDGTPFDGIRFIDRFALVDGRLAEQQVWNDMAEHRPAPAAA